MSQEITKEVPAKETSTEIVTEKTVEVKKFHIEDLIARAIDKAIPVDTMERLLVMAREVKADQAREAFNRSMAKFQSECPTIVKTKEVHTRTGTLAYKYAPIESIVEQVKPYLQSNGFSYSTNMEVLPAGVKVSCKVVHIDGHSEVSEMEVPLGERTNIMSASQVTAAASTFAKRYAFCNAFGILTGDEDNDGQTVKPDTKTYPAEPTVGDYKDPKNVPVCPHHNKPMAYGKYGYYCKTRVGEGWCKYRPFVEGEDLPTIDQVYDLAEDAKYYM